jgi:hypothetical protein
VKGHYPPATSSESQQSTQPNKVPKKERKKERKISVSTMTANIDTILILGATSGLGEAFTRYFHSKGKKVIAAGKYKCSRHGFQVLMPLGHFLLYEHYVIE